MGNTYQVRTVSQNGVGLPSSGGIIKEEHLNDEFTSLIAAFNASTGHSHNGVDSTRIGVLGANQELQTTTTAIFPGSGTIDVGTTGAKFRDGFFSGSLRVPTIADANGAESIKIVATSSAVNEFSVTNAATGGDVTLTATGDDTNISMVFTPKGTGLVKVAKDDLAIGGTAVTTTAAELNVLDGDVTSIGTTAVAGGDGIITSDAGVMKSTSVDTFDTYFSQTTKALTNKTLTAPVFGGISTTASGNLQVKPATNIVEVQGNGSDTEGQIKLNCHANSHGQTIKAQPHSESVTNTMLLPKGSNSTLVSLVSTDTLSNKTLTAPKFADAGFIADANGNEMIVFQTTTSAENALEITNGASGGAVVIGAFSGGGEDANIDITITPKGTGEVNIAQDDLNYGGTAITATGAEINLIRGGQARGSDALADGDGILINDGGTMKMTNVQTVKTYMSGNAATTGKAIAMAIVFG
jgi:hypothetical protein